MRRRNKEDAACGPAYLASLTDGLPRALNIGHYAKTVREKATSRQLIHLSNETICRCYEGEKRPAEILERAESQIFRIAAREIRGGFEPTRKLPPRHTGISRNRRGIGGRFRGSTLASPASIA